MNEWAIVKSSRATHREMARRSSGNDIDTGKIGKLVFDTGRKHYFHPRKYFQIKA